MKITILTDNLESWIIPYIEKLIVELSYFHEIDHVYKISDISKGDIPSPAPKTYCRCLFLFELVFQKLKA